MAYGAELRARYPEAARCVCTAEGERVPADAFRVRTMNFGQHWRTPGIVDVPYRAEIPAAFLRDMARRELPQWMEDAREFPDDDEEMDAALREAGWPAPDDAVADPRLASLIAEQFAYDLLAEWFDAGRPDLAPGWLLNTVDAVSLEADAVVIGGRARRADVPGVYQDL